MIKLYKNSYSEAVEKGELEQWNESIAESRKCARAIDKLVLEFLNPISALNVTGLLNVLSKEYGFERVKHIIAAQVVKNDWDNRYTNNVRKWAEKQMDTTFEGLKDCCDKYDLRTHPIIVNGLAYNILKRDKEYKADKSAPTEENDEIEL